MTFSKRNIYPLAHIYFDMHALFLSHRRSSLSSVRCVFVYRPYIAYPHSVYISHIFRRPIVDSSRVRSHITHTTYIAHRLNIVAMPPIAYISWLCRPSPTYPGYVAHRHLAPFACRAWTPMSQAMLLQLSRPLRFPPICSPPPLASFSSSAVYPRYAPAFYSLQLSSAA